MHHLFALHVPDSEALQFQMCFPGRENNIDQSSLDTCTSVCKGLNGCKANCSSSTKFRAVVVVTTLYGSSGDAKLNDC